MRSTGRLAFNPVSTNALPVERIEPIDVSNALAHLASDEAHHVTGTAFPVDAGSTNPVNWRTPWSG